MYHSLICSEHFIGNCKSKDPKSPSFIPSLFPSVYKKRCINEQQASNRYQRSRHRQEIKQNAFLDNDVNKSAELRVLMNYLHPMTL